MAVNALEDSFLPQPEKCGSERVSGVQGRSSGRRRPGGRVRGRFSWDSTISFLAQSYTWLSQSDYYHWLPIRERVKFKVACLVRQSLSGQVPLYLADDFCLVSDSTRRSLRSADIPTCLLCQEHTAVTATELLQPLDLACGTLFRSSCAIQTSAMDCLDDSWRDIFLVNHERGALWLLDMWRLRKTLTYLLTSECGAVIVSVASVCLCVSVPFWL